MPWVLKVADAEIDSKLLANGIIAFQSNLVSPGRSLYAQGPMIVSVRESPGWTTPHLLDLALQAYLGEFFFPSQVPCSTVHQSSTRASLRSQIFTTLIDFFGCDNADHNKHCQGHTPWLSAPVTQVPAPVVMIDDDTDDDHQMGGANDKDIERMEREKKRRKLLPRAAKMQQTAAPSLPPIIPTRPKTSRPPKPVTLYNWGLCLSVTP